MTINHKEILGMLESHKPITELSAGIQRRQELIEKIIDLQNPGETKDLITIAHEFKELVKLNEEELNLRYLSKKYPYFKFELEDRDIHAVLRSYLGKTLPDFPSGLKYLGIFDCENLEALREFPPGLEILFIHDCDKIKVLPEFPPGLKYLRIEGCRNLGSIPELPSGLKELNIYNCPNLGSVPEFPPGLKSLRITTCPNLGSIPEFPPGLETLRIYHCPNLTQETLDRIKEFNKKQS